MKQLFGAAAMLLILASCSQKEEKREEFKEDHYKNEMVNDLGDSAVAATPATGTVAADTTTVKMDTVK